MQVPPQITFKEIDHSDFIEAAIQKKINHLERVHGRITSCNVRVRAPHQRHRKGTHYIIEIDVVTPTGDVHIGREPGNNFAHEDVYVTIRDAFNAAERKLRKMKEEVVGRPEVLVSPLQGKIETLNTVEGFGQIATTDNRLIYFHRNAVLNNGFTELAVGDTVELSVDEGDADAGPHASMVRLISSRKFVDKPE
jgi:ribosomal subunit interface protein